MTVFSFRLRFFWAVSSLSLLLLTLMLLLPTEAVSVPLQQATPPRVAVDKQQTVEVSNPHGSDPLTPSEIESVKKTADASDTVKNAKANAEASGRPPGLSKKLEAVQSLYAQRYLEENKRADAQSQSRKAIIFYYNYLTNEVIRAVVNLKANANSVHKTEVVSGVVNQPYVTSLETEAALELIFQDPKLGPRLQATYQEITGQNLTDINQLEAQGGIFFPDSAANTSLEDITAACGPHRCIQIFITLGDNSFIDMSDVVVDLSTGEILTGGEGLTGQTH